MSAILAAALDYAGHSLRVFPAPPDSKKSYKSAEHSNGAKWGATADPAEVRRDFVRWPNARIGIPTGAVNAIVVIDTDTIAGGHAHDGEPELKKLEAKYGPLPQQTRRVLSPSGSKHGYFQHPGKNIKIVSRTIAPGVDCKGDGGMVIGAGSVNPDGRAYRLIDASPPAALPEAWIDFLKFKQPTIRERATAAVNAHRLAQTTQQGGGSAYGSAALQYELANIGRAEVGTRNYVLNRAAFSMGQLVAAGMLDPAEVAQRLFDAAIGWGNPDKDRDVIRYAMQAGMQHPRSRPTR
jgi:hypothetical protein